MKPSYVDMYKKSEREILQEIQDNIKKLTDFLIIKSESEEKLTETKQQNYYTETENLQTIGIQEQEDTPIPSKQELDKHIQENIAKNQASIKSQNLTHGDSCDDCQKFKRLNSISYYGMCNISGNLVLKTNTSCARFKKSNRTKSSWG